MLLCWCDGGAATVTSCYLADGYSVPNKDEYARNPIFRDTISFFHTIPNITTAHGNISADNNINPKHDAYGNTHANYDDYTLTDGYTERDSQPNKYPHSFPNAHKHANTFPYSIVVVNSIVNPQPYTRYGDAINAYSNRYTNTMSKL